MSVKIVGLEKVNKKLKKNVQMDAVRKVVMKHGADMQRKAQRNAPVDTGTLKRSIGLGVVGTTAVVKAAAEYAPYVEWGTRFIDAQPYLKPAFEEEKELFRRDMEKLTE